MPDWRRWGAWCGLIGPVVFLVSLVAAILASPGYRVVEQWLSDLGVAPGAPFFNGGVMATGLLAIPFALGLAQALRPSRLALGGTSFLIASAAALSGVGLFTEATGSLHTYVSYAFFLLLGVALLLLALPLLRTAAFRPLGGPATAATLVVGFGSVAAVGFSPVTEWVAVFASVAWEFVVALLLARSLRAR